MGIKDYNKVIFQGRNCVDVELKQAGEAQLARIVIAVDKSYKKDDEWVNQADFIPVKLWNKTAEFAANNLSKGDLIRVEGRPTVEQYEKDGEKRTDFYIKPDFGFSGLTILEKKSEKKDVEVVNHAKNSAVPF